MEHKERRLQRYLQFGKICSTTISFTCVPCSRVSFESFLVGAGLPFGTEAGAGATI